MNISVIIPAFNAAPFLRRAVESAIQHKEVKEILIIEDGSVDSTLEVCKILIEKFKEVKLLQHPNGENRGAGASRNLGILNASQDFISFLDADDYFTPIRFEKEREIFKNNPDIDGVYGAIGVEFLDAKGATAWEDKGFDKDSLTTVNKPIKPKHLFEFLISFNNPDNYKGYYSIDGFTVKRKSLLNSGVLFENSLRLHQDTVFLWQLAYFLKLFTGEHEKAIAIRGVHANNRFIHATKLHLSRSKQFKVLRDWANKNHLKPEICNRFQQKYFKHFISSKRKLFRIPFYVSLLLTDAITRSNFGKKQLRFVWSKVKRN